MLSHRNRLILISHALYEGFIQQSMRAGACLALHFGAWVESLKHTSLPHALLFVTSSPILITVGALIMRSPISRGEVVGAVVGFLGMVLLCLDSTSSAKVLSSRDPHHATPLSCAADK